MNWIKIKLFLVINLIFFCAYRAYGGIQAKDQLYLILLLLIRKLVHPVSGECKMLKRDIESVT